MKEELFAEAMELAQKCLDIYNEYEMEKKKNENASLERMEELVHDHTKFVWYFVGFCRALFEIDIFNKEDIRALGKVAIPPDYHPQGIVDFINGLKDIDKLSPG